MREVVLRGYKSADQIGHGAILVRLGFAFLSQEEKEHEVTERHKVQEHPDAGLAGVMKSTDAAANSRADRAEQNHHQSGEEDPAQKMGEPGINAAEDKHKQPAYELCSVKGQLGPPVFRAGSATGRISVIELNEVNYGILEGYAGLVDYGFGLLIRLLVTLLLIRLLIALLLLLIALLLIGLLPGLLLIRLLLRLLLKTLLLRLLIGLLLGINLRLGLLLRVALLLRLLRIALLLRLLLITLLLGLLGIALLLGLLN